MFKEFKEFALRGSVVDMAVGIIIGAAFGVMVKSLVDDVLMPPLGLLVGNLDFADLFLVLREGKVPGPYFSVAAARQAGAVTWNYGQFLNTVINFVIVAAAIFLVIKGMNQWQRQKPADPTTKECPFCTTSIPLHAKRCPHCTSDLSSTQGAA